MKKNLDGFEEFLTEDKNLASSTIKNYRAQVNKFFKEYNGKIDNAEAFVNIDNNPIRKSALKKYLEFLGEDKLIEDYIVDLRIEKPERKEPKTLTWSKANSLIQHLVQSDEKELAVICMLILDTGGRVGAIIRIKMNHIKDGEDGKEVVLREKNDKYPTRDISDNTWKYIEKFYGNKIGTKKYLFFDRKRITDEKVEEKYSELYSNLKNYSRKFLGKDYGISFHWLRRTAGVKVYLDSDKDIIRAQDFLNHESTDVTKRYLKLEAQKSRETMRGAERKW